MLYINFLNLNCRTEMEILCVIEFIVKLKLHFLKNIKFYSLFINYNLNKFLYLSEYLPRLKDIVNYENKL